MSLNMKPKIYFPAISNIIEDLEADAEKLEQIVAEVIEETVEYLKEEMVKKVNQGIKDKRKSTGAAAAAIKASKVTLSNGVVSGSAGALKIRGKDKAGFHLVYMEYGSPTRAPTPWFRPVMDNEDAINRIQKQGLRDRGIPIE